MRPKSGVYVIAGAMLLLAGLTAPAHAQQPPATDGAQADTRPVRGSWVSDSRVLQVGEIVTIIVDEFTLAESNRDESASRRRRRNTGAGFGLNGPIIDYDVGSQNDVDERTRGEAARTDRFAAEISVRVVETAPGGLVRVEGVKKLQIDGHTQDVTVRGWLRSNDVRPGNTVESWRVADAEIIYGSNQTLGTPTESIWDKLFKWIVP